MVYRSFAIHFLFIQNVKMSLHTPANTQAVELCFRGEKMAKVGYVCHVFYSLVVLLTWPGVIGWNSVTRSVAQKLHPLMYAVVSLKYM